MSTEQATETRPPRQQIDVRGPEILEELKNTSRIGE